MQVRVLILMPDSEQNSNEVFCKEILSAANHLIRNSEIVLNGSVTADSEQERGGAGAGRAVPRWDSGGGIGSPGRGHREPSPGASGALPASLGLFCRPWSSGSPGSL